MKVAAVVLAAGLGTRMKSSLPKVLHPLHGRPMLQYVINTLSRLKPQRIVTVVGQSAGLIRSSIHGPGALSYVLQREPKGTGDALRRAVPSLGSFRGTILVVNGDSPLLTAGTIRQFLARHRKKKNDISLLSFIASAPGSYGRILRGSAFSFSIFPSDKSIFKSVPAHPQIILSTSINRLRAY